MQNPNLQLSAILFYLSPTQIRALQSTNKTIRRAALASFKELIYNSALILPWLRSNIGNLVNLSTLSVQFKRFAPGELHTLLQVLNQGTFYLLNFNFIYTMVDNIYVHNQAQNVCIRTFFAQHCTRLIQLKLYSQDLLLIQNTFPHLQTLSIDFNHYKELDIKDASIWQHRLSKLCSITINNAPSWFVAFFLDYCTVNKIYLREITLIDIELSPEGYRPLEQIVPVFASDCSTRLKKLSITSNDFVVGPDFIFNPILGRLLTPALEHLVMDILTREQFEILGTQCPRLNHLDIKGIYAMIYSNAEDFYHYLTHYPNSELKALLLNNSSIIERFNCDLHTIFPKLIEFGIYNNEQVQIAPKLWTSLSKCNLEKIFIESDTTTTFSANSEFLKFLIGQKNLIEFVSSAELLIVDFTMLMNILLRLPKLKSLILIVEFADAFMLATYLIHMPLLQRIEIYFRLHLELEEIIEIMTKFCKFFQQLNIIMPELHTMELILNLDNTLIIPLIPNFENVFQPMFSRNCPKLKNLRLGW